MGTIAQMDVKLAMDASDFEAGVAKAQQSSESMVAKLQKTGSMLSLGVTAPLLGIAGAAVKSAGDFESSMNVLQSVIGATSGDMATMTEQALKLGAETSFSAGEAAEAMLELGKGGMTANEILGATPGVLTLAAAGGLSVASAAEIAANAVNTFGLEATETTNVANMLAAAANASSADVSELAQGFKAAGSVFAANGQSMSDLTTAMSLMANAGIAGSDAGTSLKSMLMRLTAPTAEASKAMTALGLEVYNSDGSMRSFEAIVGDLTTVTKDLSDEQRNAALSTIFGADAIRAANIMTAAGAEGFAEMEAAVNKQGAAAEAAGARMKGFSGAMDYLMGSIDSVMIAVSARFLPVFTQALKAVADFVSGFATLPPEMQNGVLAFAAVAAAAGPVMLAISGITAAIGFLASPIGLVVVGVAALAAAWTSNFGGIQDITTAAVAQITTALQTLIGPMQEVGLSIADAGVFSSETWESMSLLPGPLAAIGQAFIDMGMQASAVGASLQTFFAPAVARIQEAFDGLGPSMSTLAEPLQKLQDAFVALWDAVSPILAQLATAIGATLAVAADAGLNLIASTIQNLPALIGPMIDQVTASITLIGSTIEDVATLISAVMKGDWDAAFKSGKDIVGNFETYFKSTFDNIQSIVTTVIKVVYDTITTTLSDMGINVEDTLNRLSTFWKNIWDNMALMIQPVLDAIDGLKKGIEGFTSWISGISIPNPFAGISVPDLSGLGIPGLAVGGSAMRNQPYIVGERGPEFFIPNKSGTVIPNNKLGDWMTGMSPANTPVSGSPLIGTANIYNDVDIRQLAYAVSEYQQRRR